MPYRVDLGTYNNNYYGYLDPEVKYTLGQMQLQVEAGGGNQGVPGIVSTATLQQMSISDQNGVEVGQLEGVVVEAQHLISTGVVEFTGIHSYESNDAARAGGLHHGAIYRTSEGHVRVVY